MAFFRKKKTFPVLIIVSILITLFALASVFYYFYQTKLDEIITKYDKEIEELSIKLYSLKRQVLVPKRDIPFGTVITMDMFNEVEMNLDIPQKQLIDQSDIGKVNTVKLLSGLPVIKTSVADEKLADDLREQEFNMFLVQTNQKKGDFVDVRIIFPNGENYIVLSKKQIIDLTLKENITRIWLNESEIHSISSAIIDAYVHEGTKIYITTYIMPELQEAATPFYAANEDVLNLMRNDPNILQKASDSLARQARATIEANLKVITDENANKVTTGVNEELSKNQESIQKQQTNEEIIKKSQESLQDKSGEINSESQDIIREDTQPFN